MTYKGILERGGAPVPGGRSGGGGRGWRCRERRFRQRGLYTAYALFEALSVADMVGPSRRAPVGAEAMHFYCEHGWLPRGDADQTGAAVTGSGYETSDGRVARIRSVGWDLSPSLACRCLHPEPGVVILLRAMAGTRWLSPRLSLTLCSRLQPTAT
jgi:hypothetical protein